MRIQLGRIARGRIAVGSAMSGCHVIKAPSSEQERKPREKLIRVDRTLPGPAYLHQCANLDGGVSNRDFTAENG